MLYVTITRDGSKIRAAHFDNVAGPGEHLAEDWAASVIENASANDSATFAYTVATVEPREAAALRDRWNREAEAFARLG